MVVDIKGSIVNGSCTSSTYEYQLDCQFVFASGDVGLITGAGVGGMMSPPNRLPDRLAAWEEDPM